jgi:lipid II:glycine glycyltransferase (peptidoglycan interpeptide bridge formation enzyme)
LLDFKTIQNRDEWDSALAQLPAAHALQSWDWGQFKSRWGWLAERIMWFKAGAPVAAAQILARPIPHTPWLFLYASKGPALDYNDTQLVEQVLTDLEAYARQSRALFIKIDPDVILQLGESAAAACPPAATGQAALNVLTRRGWRFSPEQIQFRNTVLVDLNGEPDELLARMKSKWRYNIRLAQRKGVEARCGTPADLPLFYQMYAETAARDGFLIRPAAYYQDVWQLFMQAGRAELLLAQVGGEVVAGLILFIFGSKAWYMYGASTEKQRHLMPNHLLQWQAMLRAKTLGCIQYDMWGAPDVFDASDSLWGVYRFKQGFGGQTAQGLGAFDYPVRLGLHWAFTKALPGARSLLRKFKRELYWSADFSLRNYQIAD